MQAEDGLHLRVVEGALLDHERRPALLALRRSLLRRLEEEDDGSGKAVAESGEDLGRAEEDGGVGVVAAGVHDARDLALVGGVALFLDRQGVDVGAQGHDSPGLAATENAHDAGLRHGVTDLEPEGAQALRHHPTRALLAVAQLGVSVQLAADRDDVGGEGVRRRLDLGVGNGGHGQEQAERENHQCLLGRALSYVRCDRCPVTSCCRRWPASS